MGKLKRFARLTMAERLLLIRVLLVVGVARATLWLLPIEAARKAVARAAAGTMGHSRERLVWAVRVASRYLPRATCLTQALAAQALLAHSGYPSQVEIGVTKDESHCFHAHAWVVCQGDVVLGGQQVERYNPLMTWERQE
jgi:transglutaminase superfamily protein